MQDPVLLCPELLVATRIAVMTADAGAQSGGVVDAALVDRTSQALGSRLASVQAGVSTLHQSWPQKRHETKQQGQEQQHLDAQISIVKFAVERLAAWHANANELPSWRETLGACCAATAGSSWRRLPSNALRTTSRARAAASVRSSGHG
jgi:hypothetical protein